MSITEHESLGEEMFTSAIVMEAVVTGGNRLTNTVGGRGYAVAK